MPAPVGGEVGGAVEHLVALGAPVLHVDYHGAPGGQKEVGISTSIQSAAKTAYSSSNFQST